MEERAVTPTNDRHVLGMLNELAFMLDAYLDERSFADVALHLANAPCSPIGMECPRDVARRGYRT